MKTRIFDKKCNACNASDVALVEIKNEQLELQLCKSCSADFLISLLNFGCENLKCELRHIENVCRTNHEDVYEINKKDGTFIVIRR